MATGVEKVHGQRSAEAFSRLRNDHEQFLEAYESELLYKNAPPFVDVRVFSFSLLVLRVAHLYATLQGCAIKPF